MKYFTPSFPDVVVRINDQIHALHLDVSDTDMTQPERCAIWIISCSPKASCSISMMRSGDDETVVLLQSCFLAHDSNVVLKGPKRTFSGGNDRVAEWVTENLAPFIDLIRLTTIITDTFPEMVNTSRVGILIEENQKVSTDPAKPRYDHIFRVRFPVRQHIVDSFFKISLLPETVSVTYEVKGDPVTKTVTTASHETIMIGRIFEAFEAMKSRFFVDPDIYYELLQAPGLYGDNVVALPQKSAKNDY